MATTQNPPVSVAIVGAGPAGLFAAQALLAQSRMPVSVDIMDRLPSPYGLVRYRVAPDHPTIKSVVSALHEILLTPRARFIGGVDLGRTVTRGDLRASYDAVVYATGAPYVQLAATDIPTSVLPHLAAAPVREVHLIARRGPEHAKFSTRELRELGSIDGISAHVDPHDLATASDGGDDRRVRANLAVFRGWSEQPTFRSERQVRFHFYEKPVAVLGDGRVEAIRLERTAVDAAGG